MKSERALNMTKLCVVSMTIAALVCSTFPSHSLAAGPEEGAGSSKAEPKKDEDLEVREIHGSQKSLTLSIGISKTLEFPFDIGPIYLTDPSLFEFRRMKDGEKERRLFLTPKNAGNTDMTVHDSQGNPRITYSVQVTREDLGQIISQLDQLLGDIEGIKIKAIGDSVVIDGEILLPKDMIRIIRVVDAMKDRDPKKKEVPIRNLATISKMTMNIIAERIEREINSPEISARVLNNNILLEGTAESDFEADRAVEIAKTYLPEVLVEKNKGDGNEVKIKANGGNGGGLPVIIDFLRVRPRQASPPSQDIKITMNYVELSNDYDKSFNFDWRPLATDNSTVSFNSAIGSLTANVVATVSSLLPKLNTAKTHDHARILKQEQIIVKDRDDQPSQIESSLDYYATSTNANGTSSMQPITVTNLTKIKAATIPGSDSIDLGVQISLNTLLGVNNGAPIIARNSLQTKITIKNGDSAALGGYAIDKALAGYNQAANSGSQGSPVGQTVGANGTNGGSGSSGSTGSILPFFPLTRSKEFSHQKQQYIIFITPEVIRTASAGTDDMSRKFRLNAGER
jgi:pilus assembly protein CpaC